MSMVCKNTRNEIKQYKKMWKNLARLSHMPRAGFFIPQETRFYFEWDWDLNTENNPKYWDNVSDIANSFQQRNSDFHILEIRFPSQYNIPHTIVACEGVGYVLPWIIDRMQSFPIINFQISREARGIKAYMSFLLLLLLLLP